MWILLHFNSQPNEEADWYTCFKTSEGGISTHSLTRRLTGATVENITTETFQLTASRGG